MPMIRDHQGRSTVLRNREKAVSWAALIALPVVTSPAANAQALTPGRSIDLRVGIRSTYDTNTTSSRRNSVVPANLKKGDLRTTPNITMAINLPWGRNSFSLSGLLGYDFYLHNTRLNRERIDLNAGANLVFPRCNAGLTGQYQRSQSQLGYYGSAAGAPLTALVKNTQTTRGIDVTASCGATIGFRPTVGFGYQRGSNSNSLLQNNARDSINYNGGLAYVNPSLGTANIFVSRAQTRYDNRLVPGTTRKDGFNVMSYGAGISRNIGAPLSASAQVSYTTVHSRNPLRTGSSGLNWSVDAGLRATPRLQLSAQFARKVGTSLTFTSAYTINTDYNLGANYALTSRLKLNGSYKLQHRKINGFQSTFGPTVRNDTVDQQSLGLSFARNQAMTFTLRGGRDHRHAGSGNFYGYTNYLAEVGVDMRF